MLAWESIAWKFEDFSQFENFTVEGNTVYKNRQMRQTDEKRQDTQILFAVLVREFIIKKPELYWSNCKVGQ